MLIKLDYRDISLSKIRSGSVVWIKDILETKNTYSCCVNQFPSLAKSGNNVDKKNAYMPYMYNNSSVDIPTNSGSSAYLMPVNASHISILQNLAIKHPDLLICNTHLYCANNSAYAIVTNKENKKCLLFAFSLISQAKSEQSNNDKQTKTATAPDSNSNVSQSSANINIAQSSSTQATEYYQNYYTQCVYAANAAQAQYSAISNQLPNIAKNTPAYTAMITQATHLYAQYQQLSSQAQLAMMHARQSIQSAMPSLNSGFKSLTSNAPSSPQCQRSNSESTVLSALRASSPAKNSRNDDKKITISKDNNLQPEVPICDSFLNSASNSISSTSSVDNKNVTNPVSNSMLESSKANLFSKSPIKTSNMTNNPQSLPFDNSKSVITSANEKQNNLVSSNLAAGLQSLKKHFSVALEKFSKSPIIQAANNSPPFASINDSASPTFSSIAQNENNVSNSVTHSGLIGHSPAFLALKNHKTPLVNSLSNENSMSPISGSNISNSIPASAPTPLLGSVNWSPALSSSNFANSLTALQMRMHPTSASLSRINNQNLPFLLSSPDEKIASPKFNSEVTSQILNILSNSPALGGLIHNDDQQWSMLESSPEIQMALQLVANSDEMNSAEVLELLNEVGLATHQNKNSDIKEINKDDKMRKNVVDQKPKKANSDSESPPTNLNVEIVHDAKDSRKTKERSESEFLCFSHKNFDVLLSTNVCLCNLMYIYFLGCNSFIIY